MDDESRLTIGSLSWWILIVLLILMLGFCIYLFFKNRLQAVQHQTMDRCYRLLRHLNNDEQPINYELELNQLRKESSPLSI
jgi:hypothetical protein